MSRRRGMRGYILAEALVSAALASLAGALSVTLLIWSAQSIDRSQSALGAIRVLDRLYEEARLATPDALGRPASGYSGRYQWVRIGGRSLDDTAAYEADPKLAYAPIQVSFYVQWSAAGRVERRTLQAIVRPASAAPTP